MSPLFLFVYTQYGSWEIAPIGLPYLLMALCGLSELSDAFDGYFARKYNQVTDFGKILDPMADSMARISIFLTFTLEPVRLPIFLIFIFLYRDSVISTLRTICALKGFALAARRSGKIKAVLQAAATFFVLILMIPHAMGTLSGDNLTYYSSCAVGIAAIYTLYSGLEYIYANWSYIRRIAAANPAS
jgi:CDP-diacylglycerol--glycerol-3-phosphate 3-phosphatidyltransferase